MNIQQSDSEEEEERFQKDENYIDYDPSSDSSDDEKFEKFFNKENKLVPNFKDLINFKGGDKYEFEKSKESNFKKNALLLIKFGFNEEKINEYYNKIFFMNHEILKKQLNGTRTTKGEMYLKMALKFLK